MQDKKIMVASDHAGFELKKTLVAHLAEKGYDVTDLGPYTDAAPVDYPDMAALVANDIRTNPEDFGILVCGSGEGMCMAANKYPFIRAGLVYNEETAEMIRRHNNANVICFGGRMTKPEMAVKALDIFLTTPFEGGRHERRIQKLGDLK